MYVVPELDLSPPIDKANDAFELMSVQTKNILEAICRAHPYFRNKLV